MARRTTSLERCYKIIKWLQENPTQRRFAKDIAEGTGLHENSIRRTMQDFPNCFEKERFLGWRPTGEWPNGIPMTGAVDANKPPVVWHPAAMKQMNTIWKAHTGQNPLQTLQVAEREEVEFIAEMGRQLTKLAEELIESGKIGTPGQDEWRPAE